MNLLEIGSGEKRTFLNLDNLNRLVLLKDGRIEVYAGAFFDILTEGSKGYTELLKLVSKGEKKSEGKS